MNRLLAIGLVLGCATIGCTRSERPPLHPDVTMPDSFVVTDAGHPIDAGQDAGMDASSDANALDAGHDAGFDGGHDGGNDAGPDAAMSDAGPPIVTWSTNATTFSCATPGVIGSHATYHCPPGGAAASIWGTGEYTNDSSICTAAVHAGRITLIAGGDITIELRAGRSAYVGSLRGGITSNNYGTWPCSYAVIAPSCLSTSAMDCSGLCADLTSDHQACGACGHPCNAMQTCSASTCVCPGTTTVCGASCVDTMTDSANCGMCGMTCDATHTCSSGSCVCAPGRMACGASCVDLSSDPMHCGGCANACAPGEYCIAMHCGARPATWSTNATDHDCSMPGVLGSMFSYACPAGGAAGSAWGTDLYTHDSSICTAAVHAGRVTLAAGGTVTISMQPGALSYTGSTRNGITTNSYGSWSCSYSFP